MYDWFHTRGTWGFGYFLGREGNSFHWPYRKDIIADSPPISLSLIVGESKYDAKASVTCQTFFNFFPREPYIIYIE